MRIKKTLHSFGQRGPKCTPIFGLSSKNFFEKIYPFTCSHWEAPNYRVFLKNFLSGKKPSHLFGITSLNDTLFHRKNEKIFFIRLQALYFACPEKAFSLIPTENSKMHTLNRKKFLSLHLFGIERSKRNLFFRKKAKIFLKRRFVSKHPLTCSHWQRIFGDSNLEKKQKNLPANIGGHTFDKKI